MERRRTKGLPMVPEVLGQYKSKVSLDPESVVDVVGNSDSTETVCLDELHPNHPHSGGPFSLSRKSISYSNGHGRTGYAGKKRVFVPGSGWQYIDVWSIYEGAFQCNAPAAGSALIAPIPPDSSSDTASYGADGWNRFKPAAPVVGLGQFFGELRSIRDLMFRRLSSFRNLGSNYLAVEFGWKPFLRDLRDFFKSLEKIDRQVAQLRRDNGRWIRRGGSLRTDDIPDDTSSGDENVFNPILYGENFSWSSKTTTEEKVWFSGSFRYFIPGLLDQKWGSLRAKQELWDLKITPELVYQLIPWTWLVDWFSNLGSVVSNLQSSIDDHLVAKYAYVMRHSSTTTDVRCAGTGLYGDGTGITTRTPVSARVTIRHETKARAAADPFGFSASLPNLSDWQISILAALGLSRS